MMFGLQSEHQDRSEYERSIERGETVLAVTVADEDADAVMSILERQSPLDVDAQATERGSAEAEAAPEQRREEVPARAEASGRQRAREQEQEEAARGRESERESAETAEGEEVIPLAEESSSGRQAHGQSRHDLNPPLRGREPGRKNRFAARRAGDFGTAEARDRRGDRRRLDGEDGRGH